MGETLIRAAIETQLQRPQHRLGFSRRADAQQAEMIDGQFHQRCAN